MDLDHKQPWLTSKTFIRRYHFPRVSSKICLSHKEVKTYHFPITMYIQCCLPVHAQLQARDGQPSERSPERLRRRHLSTCCMTILRPASAYCRMTIVTKSLAASGLAAMLRLNMLVSWLSILPPSICIRQELRALLLQTPSTSSLSVHVCLSVCEHPSASREKLKESSASMILGSRLWGPG